MDRQEFSSTAAGRLITIEGSLAFLPDPLPPQVEVDRQMLAE